jgi:hypothetical protein
VRALGTVTGALVIGAIAATAASAWGAEGDEEVIDDPLAHAPAVSSSSTSASANAGAGASAGTNAGAGAGASAGAPRFHVDVWMRSFVDTKWTRDDVAPSLGEDVVRERLRTTFGVTGGNEGALKYALEVRLNLEARAKKGPSGGPLLDRDTWLYEAIPTAAFVEVPIGDRVRVRAGEQVVAWGRMDLASAADVLERRDLREPPSVDPSGLRLPTPTIRTDVHVSDAIDATFAWTVVAMPHKYELFGSSWALVGPGVIGAAPMRATIERFAGAMDQTQFVRLQQALVDASTPSARLDGGEIAARFEAHVGGADLGLTYGWIRSKLPVIDVDPLLRNYRGGIADGAAILQALNDGRQLFSTSFPRYHQLALDLEGTAGPFTLSWELGFTPKRALFTTPNTALVPSDLASGFPVRADAPLVQAGVRAQLVQGDTIVAAEVDGFEVTEDPPPGGGAWLGFGAHRMLLAGLASVETRVLDEHVLDLGVLTTSSGPSLALMPRWSWELDDAWSLGLAASFFPKLRTPPARDGVTLADVLYDRDFVEAFVRWRR